MKSFLKGFAGALAGGAFLFLAWTAYVDHARVNVMWEYLNRAKPAAEAK